MRSLCCTAVLGMLVMSSIAAKTVDADEGMWLFNNPPTKLLKEVYGFDPTPEWLAHLQQSAVRFNSGGSGSFVSRDGLVMTNHHVAADALQKLSTPEQDYIVQGFHARTQTDEKKAVDLELNVLMSIEDVTARVNAAVKPGISAAEAHQARRAVMATIEKESLDKTGLRSDVVTLYQGGLYHLYRYKKYTDVRLVFAPEKDIAFFGGDPDNFEYPRYDLDVSFFRVYENGKPAQLEHYLSWSASGAADGELIFVAGHPGRTDRQNTVAHLHFMRDRQFPSMLNTLRRREVLYKTYSERSLENARRAQDEYFGVQNSRKARLGGLAGLQDPEIIMKKRFEQAALKKTMKDEDPAHKAFAQLRNVLGEWRKIYTEWMLLEQQGAFNTDLFDIARTLVRLADETAQPNEKRLREYRESNLESLKQRLFSEAPIYNDLETQKLTDSLSMMIELIGADNELVRKIQRRKGPQDAASELVSGTTLGDPKVRKQLAEGGKDAITASRDPMIALARLVDPPARSVRKTYEEQVEEPMRQAYAKIAEARFKASGTNNYPDATFTLRLALGVVKGYKEGDRELPPWTTIGGAYRHAEEHHNVSPFALPKSWLEAKDKLNLDTPLNFVSTADIIGGNSGSPVVNRKGEVVGIIFDGNMHSLVLDFVYTEDKARAVSVASQSIIEALRKVYDAGALADELQRAPGSDARAEK